ncbi:hypothetical protein BDP67DRAFT_533792 [Colletotrichum lupini]|nr:hypothetical protein BDP67DRAFT_533792 [Colletotrichum lupini]
MDSSLLEVWQAAASTPFQPAVAKDSQFFIAFLLLLIGVGITGFFALSKLCSSTFVRNSSPNIAMQTVPSSTSQRLACLPQLQLRKPDGLHFPVEVLY